MQIAVNAFWCAVVDGLVTISLKSIELRTIDEWGTRDIDLRKFRSIERKGRIMDDSKAENGAHEGS